MSKVSFWATKKVPQRVKVSFKSSGKAVSFWATKSAPKRVKITFRTKR